MSVTKKDLADLKYDLALKHYESLDLIPPTNFSYKYVDEALLTNPKTQPTAWLILISLVNNMMDEHIIKNDIGFLEYIKQQKNIV